MKKCLALHRANFAVTEKATHRHSAHLAVKELGVVIGLAVQAFASAHAAKEQRTFGLAVLVL